MSPTLSTHSVGDVDVAAQLAATDFVYQRLCREVDRLHRRIHPKLLPLIEGVAKFAWSSHPGRLADGALENVLLEIGRGLADVGPLSKVRLAAPPGSRTLHIASELFVTGGHSRVLAKWVQRDVSSSHSIVLTRQRSELPAFLVAIAAEREASITMLDPDEAIFERARRLRVLSQGYDRIILHQHPDDAVPVLAYAAPGGCPVVMFNHAHFWFSLGSSVADVVINTLPYFRELTERQRFPRATDVLEGPFGLDPLRWTYIDKPAAKERLNLPPDKPVALSIGSESYFAPSGNVNFFSTVAKLLARRSDLQLLIVGVPERSALVPSYIHETRRVTLVGPVADPRPYYEAADLCLESFPMPSLGAFAEAVAYGQAFPVPAFAEAESPLRVNQHRISSVATRQRTEAEYLSYIELLLNSHEATKALAQALRQTLIRDDECFGDQFPSLYDRIASLEHAPHDLPRTACSTAPENLALASMTRQASLRYAIDLLSLRPAVSAAFGLVGAGYETPRDAVIALGRRLAPPAVRLIARGLQRGQ